MRIFGPVFNLGCRYRRWWAPATVTPSQWMSRQRGFGLSLGVPIPSESSRRVERKTCLISPRPFSRDRRWLPDDFGGPKFCKILLKGAYGALQMGKNIRYNWKTPRIWATIFCHPFRRKVTLHIGWTPLTSARA